MGDYRTQLIGGTHGQGDGNLEQQQRLQASYLLPWNVPLRLPQLLRVLLHFYYYSFIIPSATHPPLRRHHHARQLLKRLPLAAATHHPSQCRHHHEYQRLNRTRKWRVHQITTRNIKRIKTRSKHIRQQYRHHYHHQQCNCSQPGGSYISPITTTYIAKGGDNKTSGIYCISFNSCVCVITSFSFIISFSFGCISYICCFSFLSSFLGSNHCWVIERGGQHAERCNVHFCVAFLWESLD